MYSSGKLRSFSSRRANGSLGQKRVGCLDEEVVAGFELPFEFKVISVRDLLSPDCIYYCNPFALLPI